MSAVSQQTREAQALLLTGNVELVVRVLKGSGSAPGPEHDDAGDDEVLRAIAATRNLATIVDDTLHMLVRQARSAGHTWAEIGELLGVTRQAAFQRFGTPAPTTKEAGMQALEGAAEKAIPILEHFVNERFSEVRAGFDEVMLAACPIQTLVQAYDQCYGELGDFRAFGDPHVSCREGYTVVQVPMSFERGARTGQVALDDEGRVSGLYLLPRDSA